MKNTDKSAVTSQNLIKKIESLNTKNETLNIEIETLKKEKTELELRIQYYEAQFRLQQQKLFGRSSEKSDIFTQQISIFNEMEVEAKPEAPEPTIEEITYKRKKQKGHKEKILEDFPVEVIEYKLSDEELNCKCGDKLEVMSKEVTKELKIIPAQVSVVEHVRFVYSCRNCQKNGLKANIQMSKMPVSVISKSIASSSVVAYIMNEKFVKAVPLYRTEQEFHRMGLEISRQSMSNWCLIAANRWLSLLYERMRDHLLKNDILHADETTLQVLQEPGRSANSKSYMWLYRSGKYDVPIVLYEYQTTRAKKHPEKFLFNFKGYLLTDGLESYNYLEGIINVGCWVHARRYFVDAKKSLPKNNTDKATTVIEEGLKFFSELSKIEDSISEASIEERYKVRLEKSKPLIEKFKEWLKYYSPRVAPKTPLGKAIYYCKNQWNKLEAFLLDGRLEIDNNRAERSIKPFVIGRKNWLFSNTANGAKASAITYSIIETAKENNVYPFEYLKYLFDTLPNIDITDKNLLDDLLPWSDKLPNYCKSQKKIKET